MNEIEVKHESRWALLILFFWLRYKTVSCPLPWWSFLTSSLNFNDCSFCCWPDPQSFFQVFVGSLTIIFSLLKLKSLFPFLFFFFKIRIYSLPAALSDPLAIGAFWKRSYKMYFIFMSRDQNSNHHGCSCIFLSYRERGCKVSSNAKW